MKDKARKEGNVVVAFSADGYLMLDCDEKSEAEVVKFSREYATFHKHLGSSLVMKSSEDGQADLSGEKLGHYFVIFGGILNWDAILWHVQDALRLNMINKAFAAVCRNGNGTITIRLNAKNDEIPHPELICQCYFDNGENTGVMSFLRDWVNFKKMGKGKD